MMMMKMTVIIIIIIIMMMMMMMIMLIINSTCNYDYYFVGLRHSVIICKTAPALHIVAICLGVHLHVHNEDPS